MKTVHILLCRKVGIKISRPCLVFPWEQNISLCRHLSAHFFPERGRACSGTGSGCTPFQCLPALSTYSCPVLAGGVMRCRTLFGCSCLLTGDPACGPCCLNTAGVHGAPLGSRKHALRRPACSWWQTAPGRCARAGHGQLQVRASTFWYRELWEPSLGAFLC